MAGSALLEISVESVAAAVAAERGGANRIELCADLRLGGLTPPEELMRAVRAAVSLPIFAMIRPRAGDFGYSDLERLRMKVDIAIAQRVGMDGIVLGLTGRDHVTGHHRIDVGRTQMMVWHAKPLPVTFHRAFDMVGDMEAGLKDLMRAGAARVLTSGGAANALAGIESLARLVRVANERVIVVPGGGINASNVAQVARQSGAREIHSGLGSVLAYGQDDYASFENEVRKMAEQLAKLD